MNDLDLKPHGGPLTLEVEEDGDAVVIRPLGELDISTSPALNDALLRAVASGTPEVRLDLGGLTFIDSTGLRLLVSATEHSQNNGTRLRMLRGSTEVDRILRVTELDRRLPFVD